MSNGAPVCPISSSQPTAARRALSGNGQSSGIDVAHIPPAHHLISVINALNIMNNVITQVTRGVPQINNVGVPNQLPGYPALRINPAKFQYMPLYWYEADRGYEFRSKAVNPDDEEQFIYIKTLSYVVWNEQSTGFSLVYTKRIE